MRALRIAGLVGVSGLAGAIVIRRDEGLQRAVQFYSSLAPVAVRYRVVDSAYKARRQLTDWAASFDSSPAASIAALLRVSPAAEDEHWERLHVQYADRVLEHFLALRGFYIKLGQVLATRSDLVPEMYLSRFRTLEDACPAEDAATVRAIVARELGVADIAEIFARFDDAPIGAASVGQVHKAVLRDGTPVCVKVQYPGVQQLFRADINTCRFFCRFVAPEQLMIFDEIESQFLSEFDYRLEAAQLAQARENMSASAFARDVRVPAPLPALCTPHVLVMEFLPGVKLRDGIRAAGRRWAARRGTTLEELERDARATFDRDGLPPPYTGPSVVQIEWYRWLLRAVSVIVNAPGALVNAVVCRPFGLPMVPAYSPDIPLNSAAVMATLLNVSAHQIFVDGFVQADPHGGNFLLLPDGRIGLIDFGQVKRLTLADRLYLAKTVVAMARGDKARLRQLAIANGYQSKHFDADVIYKMTIFALDRDGRDVTGGKNIQQFMDDMFEQDPWTAVNSAIVMPSRVSILIRGLGLMLNHPVSVASVWGPAAEKLLKEHHLTYLED